MAKPSKKREASQPTLAGDVLQSLLQNSKSPLSDQFLRWKVWSSWPEVVGAEVAKNTLPVSYLQGELYVWVNHPARMQELIFCVRPLIRKINQYCGKTWIRRIRFTLDRRSVPKVEDAPGEMQDFLSKFKK